MSITGLPGQGPVRVGIPVADLSAGIFCALGILVALLERGGSGEGQYVESSLLAAPIAMLDFQAARLLVVQAGHLKNKGVRNTHQTSVAKLFASEAAVSAARTAIPIHGGVGYTDGHVVERHLPDALATPIYEGTSQVPSLIIGWHLSGERAFA